MKRASAMLKAMVFLGLMLQAGCSSSGPTELAVAEDRYGEVFSVARDVLRDHQFVLERVDAAAGVITTAEKPTGGLATPWRGDGGSIGTAVEDLVHEQRRIARITFESASVDGDKSRTMHVRVVVMRPYGAGLRVEPTAVWLSRRWGESRAETSITDADRSDVVSEDASLGAQLTREIERRAKAGPTAAVERGATGQPES